MPLAISDSLTTQGFWSNVENVRKYAKVLKEQIGGYRESTETAGELSFKFVQMKNDAEAKRKLAQSKVAIRALASGFDLKPIKGITVYAHNVAGLLLPSLGYTVPDAGPGDTYRFEIFIGPSAGTARPLKAGTKSKARGGLTGADERARLVMDQIYDYYRAGGMVSADDRKMLTLVFHEFGHAFHQWKSPDHYFTLGDQHMEVSMGPYVTRGQHRMRQDGIGWDSRETNAIKTAHLPYMEIGKKKVSSWSAKMGLNELVAEVFSGLCMSVPYSDAALTAYRECGGPDVPDTCKTPLRARDYPYEENA
jgi:hypothetical protein